MESTRLALVLDDLRPRLLGRPVSRVDLLGRHGVLLRFAEERAALYVSVHPQMARLGLVTQFPSLDEPRRAPDSLREPLREARLVSVTQEVGGRVATFSFERPDDRHSRPRLVAELIPRFANLILLGDDDLVMYAKREFTGEGRSREIHSGVRYTPPPVYQLKSGVSPPPLPDLELAAPETPEAFDHEYRTREILEEKVLIVAELRRDAVRRREKAAKALQHVERRSEEASKEPQIRHEAELLAAHLHRVKRGMLTIRLEDFDGTQSFDITLDPKLEPRENLERAFQRARRLARGRKELLQQREELTRTIEAADYTLAHLEDARPESEWRTLAREYVREIEKEERPSGTPRQDDVPGRRFTLAGGWEVIVGRSAQENDELTHHFAAPRDLWFHARGSGGSHTVLRVASGKGDPPQSIIEQAAAIAAHYSKSRTSGIVPVAYTERRYVRRPRKAPAGTAVMEREKVLFVEPRIPENG